jgi:hypothetical protein
MSIPASTLVSVTPSVLSAGGNPLALNGLLLSQASRLPFGTPLSFPTAASVADYFGPQSQEAAMAETYFLGFDGSNTKPGALLFSRYAATAIPAFLRSGIPTLSLAQVNAIAPASVTASIALTVMTVTAVSSGVLVPGMLLTGSGVTANTRIVNQLTGTPGGTGTYTVDTSQTTASTTITGAYDLVVVVDGVTKTASSLNLSSALSLSAAASLITTALGAGQTTTFDSTLHEFVITSSTTGASSTLAYATGLGATTLGFTAATGAVLSQGSAIQTPAAAMAAVIASTQNWVSFSSTFEPSLADKEAFSSWTNSTNGRYLYVPYDTDATAASSQPATFTGLGSWLKANTISGVAPVWNSYLHAAFVLGAIASIDFTQHNGRITLAFKVQSGLVATVTDPTSAANLIANGYNFIGAYATANQLFTQFQPGQVSGPYAWIDSYINAIWLNNQFQLALMTLLQNIKSDPYNPQGYGLIRSALQDPINQAVNFGAIRSNVPLSAAQAAEVNAAAGMAIDGILSSRGWYLQILPASAQVRAARQSPPCTFWFMDGQSIQQVNLASIDVQ